MKWSALQASVREWIAAASGLPLGSVVRSPFNGPRPALPYATYAITRRPPVQRTWRQLEVDGGTLNYRIEAEREATVRVQFYGFGEEDGEQIAPMDYASRIEGSFPVATLWDLIDATKWAPKAIIGSGDLSALVDTEHEERAYVDLLIGYIYDDGGTSGPGDVGQVTINATIGGETAAVIVTEGCGMTNAEIEIQLEALQTLLSQVQTDLQGQTLGEHADVDTSGATSGQVLGYDGGEWSPVDQSGGGVPDTFYWGRGQLSSIDEAAPYAWTADDLMRGYVVRKGHGGGVTDTLASSAVDIADAFVAAGAVSSVDEGGILPLTIEVHGEDIDMPGPTGPVSLAGGYIHQCWAVAAKDASVIDPNAPAMPFAGIMSVAESKAIPTAAVASDDVDEIVVLTQSEYDALTPDADTLYVIEG